MSPRVIRLLTTEIRNCYSRTRGCNLSDFVFAKHRAVADRTSGSFEDACQSLLRSLSVEDLDRLAEELTQLGFGEEIVLRDTIVAD
jgi:hypothetical protein